MTITSRLAEMMGGSAGAESEPGRGSRFWFTARLRRAEEAAAPPSPEDLETVREALASEYGGTRILLAEDDAINRAIAQILVSRVGLSVDCATNGGEAVTLAERDMPALILMDMQMPVLDGIEATQRIRAQPWGRTVPIIALTANAFAEDRARCMEAGMDDFVTKPITPAVLYTKLRHWLERAGGQANAR
ncbi:MAG: response regulator [Thauera sp.]